VPPGPQRPRRVVIPDSSRTLCEKSRRLFSRGRGFASSAQLRIECRQYLLQLGELRHGLEIEFDGCGDYDPPAVDLQDRVAGGRGQTSEFHAYRDRRYAAPDHRHQHVRAPVEEPVFGAQGLSKELGRIDEIVARGILQGKRILIRFYLQKSPNCHLERRDQSEAR